LPGNPVAGFIILPAYKLPNATPIISNAAEKKGNHKFVDRTCRSSVLRGEIPLLLTKETVE
jgi:hypothetical protein